MTLGSFFFFYSSFSFLNRVPSLWEGLSFFSPWIFFFPSPYFYIFPRIQERLCFLQGQTAVMDGGADSASLGKAG